LTSDFSSGQTVVAANPERGALQWIELESQEKFKALQLYFGHAVDADVDADDGGK
jgi:hypothetical protein